MYGVKSLRFHQNILMCVLKMNESVMGLDQQEGEERVIFNF